MSLRTTAYYDLGTLDAANEYTTFVYTGDFRNAIFTVIASGTANCTIKFYSSCQETRPTFASAASATNEYSEVQVINLNDGNPINGTTGLVYAGSSDGVTKYEINENANKWLGIKMTARSAGQVVLKIDLTDNQ